MPTEDNLKKAKEQFEALAMEVYANTGDDEKYAFYQALWVIADAVLQIRNDIEAIKADVREIKDHGRG